MTTDDGAAASLSGRTPTSGTGPAPPTPTTRALLACGVIAGPLFTAAWLLEGASRANGVG